MIVKGDIIEGDRWPEPIEVNLIEPIGDRIRIVGVTINSRTHIDQLLTNEEAEGLRSKKLSMDFSANPKKVFLALENLRYQFASMYDPLLAMNTSKVDPLPHQIEAVYGYILKLPRIRFLIADDPGAGKTIMAGLVLKELKLRNLAKRIMIICPGHLKDQWKREMKERFEEVFIIVDRHSMDSSWGSNVWSEKDQIITSLDYAKQEDVLPTLASSEFHLIIIDEAHKMSAYLYNVETKKTQRYRLGEVVSKITNHLLFLTATPHKGDPENFRLLLDLLDPGYFSNKELLMESIRERENPLFIRRVKEDLKDFEGKPLFVPRKVETIAFSIGKNSPLELELYNKLSLYVKAQYNLALQMDKKRNIGFALVILQRRFASSIYALWRSLERRSNKLKDLYDRSETGQIPRNSNFDFEEIEDMDEEDRWKEEQIWETLSVAENREELKREIDTIKDLIDDCVKIINEERELKLSDLRRTLDRLNEIQPGEKVLIFTESKDTLDYLEKKIRFWGYSVNTIHGSMSLDERIEAEKVFKEQSQIMVATEAAGEGINLQFCHLMINYDIPWNPNKLEQRMGRVHRYGQTKEVRAFNLVSADTREGKVLLRLFDKLKEIKEMLGSDKVFDIVSDVFQGKNLTTLLTEAAASSRSMDAILQELDITVDEEYISGIKENLGESLATRFIDYTRIKEIEEKARENRLIPEYTREFFFRAYDNLNGKIRENADGSYNIEKIPYELKSISNEDFFKRAYGPLLANYRKVTFDKALLMKDSTMEFVSFGHPLFEAISYWVKRDLSSLVNKGGCFIDPNGEMDGVVVYFEGEVKDGAGAIAGKRLFSFYYDIGENNIQKINPAFIWDLKAEGKPSGSIDIEDIKKRTLVELIGSLEEYQNELLTERMRQIRVKEKYGIESLKQLIVKLDGDVIDLMSRKEKGENVDLTLFNKERSKDNYSKSLKELEAKIAKEKVLTISTPVFLGAIRIVPSLTVHPAMKRDDEIERIGMEVTMEYERGNGRIPEDVSKENLGYDVRSTDKEGRKRYIEVKARASEGDIVLTQNEWFKAQRFGKDFYLYVVYNSSSEPHLLIINNPADSLKPEVILEKVRYLIGKDDIKARCV